MINKKVLLYREGLFCYLSNFKLTTREHVTGVGEDVKKSKRSVIARAYPREMGHHVGNVSLNPLIPRSGGLKKRANKLLFIEICANLALVFRTPGKWDIIV